MAENQIDSIRRVSNGYVVVIDDEEHVFQHWLNAVAFMAAELGVEGEDKL